MSKKTMITNAEIQNSLSNYIKAVDSGSVDVAKARVYFSGVKGLLGSIKIDIEASKQLGVPMFGRTKTFLGVRG